MHNDDEALSEAMVKVKVEGQIMHTVSEEWSSECYGQVSERR